MRRLIRRLSSLKSPSPIPSGESENETLITPILTRRQKSEMFSRTLPDEVIECVLLLLPVLTLVRFRCVCKAWNTLIRSPDFVNRHLEISAKKERILMSLNPGKSLVVESLDGDEDAETSGDRICRTVSVSIPPGIADVEMNGIQAVGSCNGLVCLFASLDARRGRYYLWNPSAGDYWVSRKWKVPRRSVFGFGYATKSRAYKIACLVCHPTNNEVEVNVFTVGSHSLRKFTYVPVAENFEVKGPGVFAAGALHWYLTARIVHDCIISFDLEKEEFRQGILLPVVERWRFAVESFVVINEKLALLARPCLPARGPDGVVRLHLCNLEIWVMEEYGVKASWTKKVTYGYTRERFETNLPPGLRSTLMPLRLMRNGNVLLDEHDDYLTVYDPEQDSCSMVNHGDWDKQLPRISYVETLVSPLNQRPQV